MNLFVPFFTFVFILFLFLSPELAKRYMYNLAVLVNVCQPKTDYKANAICDCFGFYSDFIVKIRKIGIT